ncbi:MAG: DUF389 domain-containing protein, partial [Planctomycetota bacterium]
LDTRFVLMNALAGVVASYGLLADSTATVIGAMVIATMLGAISGVALALVERNATLLRASLQSAVAGFAIVLGISFAIGLMHRSMPLSSEILSRTHPNILDLIIGIAGGAAGAYAMVSPRVNAGLVGVAIAAALVPPVAVCGLCLARGEFGLSLGAFELFLTNFAAIQFITSVMMWLFGFRPRDGLNAVELLRRNVVSLALLVLLGFALTLNLYQSIRRYQLETDVQTYVAESVEETWQAELIELSFDYRDRSTVLVTAVVVTPERLSRNLVEALDAGMPQSADYDIETKVLYILSETFVDPDADEASDADEGQGVDAVASAEAPLLPGEPSKAAVGEQTDANRESVDEP